MQHEEQIAALRFVNGRFSPDGRWFAFRGTEDGDLRLLELSTGREQVLVGEWIHATFAWSRDAARIAFIRLGEPAVRLEVVDVNGGRRRVIQQAPALSSLPRPYDWTPDGRSLLGLAASASSSSQRMGLLDLDTGAFRPIATSRAPGPLEDAKLSPDGRFVLFAARGDRDSDVFVAPIGAGTDVRVSDNPERETNALWSSDGRRIYFVRWKTEADKSFWSVAFEPSTARTVGEETLVASLGDVAWRVDPLLTSAGDLLVVRRAQEGHERVFLLTADPASGATLGVPSSTFPQRTEASSWSLAGDKLYYRAYAAVPSTTVQGRVYGERDLQSKSDRLIIQEAPPGLAPTSSYFAVDAPDGRRTAWVPPSSSILYWRDNHSGQGDHLELDGETLDADHLSWSPEGGDIAFSTQSFGRHLLAVVRIADRRVRRLAATRLSPQPVWSPDGTTLAFTDANCLMTVPAGGGTARQVVCAAPSRLPAPGAFVGPLADYVWFNKIHPSWSPDGRHIAWTVPVPELRRVELWLVDHETGRHTTAWAGEPDYATMPRGPLWSPDGRHIAFTMTAYPKDEIWAYRRLGQ